MAACRHFGVCGGCTAQDLATDDYRAWKRALVVDALSRRGLDTGSVAALVSVDPGTRRIARFGARAAREGITLGYSERASHALIDVAECPVLRPELVAALPALREVARLALKPGGFADMPVILSESGLDVVLRTATEPDVARRQALAAYAATARFARLSWQRAGRDRRQGSGPADPIANLRPVRMSFSGVAVDLPPAAFLQPTHEGEAVLSREVAAALAGAKRVADLYAGCGPFAFALAKGGARVGAFEEDSAMVAALDAAARRGQLNVVAEQRDLARRPLLAQELDRLDGVVLDPPRPGAPAQIGQIAKSKVATVAYVSCNPESFARDARTLVDGGYHLERVVPVDQFLWSAHVELVAVFKRTSC